MKNENYNFLFENHRDIWRPNIFGKKKTKIK